MSRIQERLNKRFLHWVEKRLPLQSSVSLDRKKIFIVPTLQGFALLVISILILLLAINFESSLNYALAFWLISMLWVSVHLTFRNLSGLTLSAHSGSLACVGDMVEVTLKIQSRKAINRGVLELIHHDWGIVHANVTETETIISLPLQAYSRGPVAPPRFRIESRYPFGLVVAWSNIQIDVRGWAYPEAQSFQRISNDSNLSEDDVALNDHFYQPGSEDFHSLRDYVEGDAINRLHWPAFSRDIMLIKSFSDYQAADEFIDWNQFPGVPDELKLSAIAYYSEKFYHQQSPFGIKIPGHEIPPDKGIEHLNRVRQVLAEYGYE